MRTKRGRLLGGCLLLGLVAFVWRIDDFLAITRPVNGNVLVVEGWFWRSAAMPEAAAAFKRGHYDWLVTVGDPVGGTNHESTATLAAARLSELGVDSSQLIVLPVPTMRRHQTYTSALTIRRWLATSPTPITGVDVFTLGTHARKSLVLFRRALEPEIKVGVIAGTEDTYDPNRWWRSTRGIYVVSRKTLGYLYAVFWPLPDRDAI